MNSIRNSQHKLITLDNSSLMQIIPDGCRLWKAMQMMRNGFPWEEIAARTTEKTPQRAFKMLELISSKRGGMVLKTPLELGLIEAIAWDINTRKPSIFKPTQSGMLHLQGMDFFGKVDQIDLMKNQPVWVAVYGPKDRPDMGKDMWKMAQPHFAKAMSGNDLAEMRKGLGKLIGLLSKETVNNDWIEDYKTQIKAELAQIFPLRDEAKEQLLKTLEEMEEMDAYVDEGEDPELEDDEDSATLVEEFVGSHSTIQDPDVRRRVAIGKLILAKGMDNPQQVWEEVVSPILDSYTGKGVYGPDFDYVNMPLTDEQKQAERDSMPWDTPMFTERYRKGFTQVKATVEKMTKRGEYATYDEYMISPDGFTYWTDKCPHTPRPISEGSAVKVREVSTFLPEARPYNLDDVDFEVEASLRYTDDARQRRLLLLNELMKNPEFKKLSPEEMRLEIQLLAGDPETVYGSLCHMAVEMGDFGDFTRIIQEKTPGFILYNNLYSINQHNRFICRDLGLKPYRSRQMYANNGNSEDSQTNPIFEEAYVAPLQRKSSPRLVRA